MWQEKSKKLAIGMGENSDQMAIWQGTTLETQNSTNRNGRPIFTGSYWQRTTSATQKSANHSGTSLFSCFFGMLITMYLLLVSQFDGFCSLLLLDSCLLHYFPVPTACFLFTPSLFNPNPGSQCSCSVPCSTSLTKSGWLASQVLTLRTFIGWPCTHRHSLRRSESSARQRPTIPPSPLLQPRIFSRRDLLTSAGAMAGIEPTKVPGPSGQERRHLSRPCDCHRAEWSVRPFHVERNEPVDHEVLTAKRPA